MQKLDACKKNKPIKVFVILLVFSLTLNSVKTKVSKAETTNAQKDSLNLEILGVGLQGHIPIQDEPTVIHYRIYNPGETRKIKFEIENVDPANIKNKINRYKSFRQYLNLPPKGFYEGKWILPHLYSIPINKNTIIIKNLHGKVLANIPLPNLTTKSTILILASKPEDASSIQDAILLYTRNWDKTDEFRDIQDVIVTSWNIPTIWYEYSPAELIILARKWEDMDGIQQKALTKWVSMGGNLVISPCFSPDWRSSPFGNLNDNEGNFGLGSIHIIPPDIENNPSCNIDKKSLGTWFITNNLVQNSGYVSYERSIESLGFYPPFTNKYDFLPPWMVFLFIIGIIIIIGPVTHIILSKINRRELVWIVVPGLCFLTAITGYEFFSLVKDKGNILEKHNIIFIFDKISEAPLITSTRIMSPEKQKISINIQANEPFPYYYSDYYYTSQEIKRADFEIIDKKRIEYSGVLRQRFSHLDLKFLSFLENPPPLKIHYSENSSILENNGKKEIKNIFIYTEKKWFKVASILNPGEKVIINKSWKPVVSIKNYENILSKVAFYQPDIQNSIFIFAYCNPEGLPSISVAPKPEISSSDTICIWIKNSQIFDRGIGP